MERLRVRRWLLATYLFIATALLLAPISTPSATPSNADKVAHAVLMGILATLLWQVIRLPPWSRAVAATLGTLAYAGGMELLQGLLPFRTVEIADLLASGVGTVLAVALMMVGAACRQP